MNYYKQRDLTKLFNLTPRTLRVWEDAGLLGVVERKGSNQRVYNEDNLKNLKIVIVSTFVGYSLHQIKDLIENYNSEVYSLIQTGLADMVCQTEKLKRLLPEPFYDEQGAFDL